MCLDSVLSVLAGFGDPAGGFDGAAVGDFYSSLLSTAPQAASGTHYILLFLPRPGIRALGRVHFSPVTAGCTLLVLVCGFCRALLSLVQMASLRSLTPIGQLVKRLQMP